MKNGRKNMAKNKWVIKVFIEVRDKDLARLVEHDIIESVTKDPLAKFEISHEYVYEEE